MGFSGVAVAKEEGQGPPHCVPLQSGEALTGFPFRDVTAICSRECKTGLDYCSARYGDPIVRAYCIEIGQLAFERDGVASGSQRSLLQNKREKKENEATGQVDLNFL